MNNLSVDEMRLDRPGRHERRGRHEARLGVIRLPYHWTSEQQQRFAEEWRRRYANRPNLARVLTDA